MAKAVLPTVAVLRQLLRYEPEAGKLYWRERGPEWFTDGYRTAQGEANNWNVRFAGKEAGGVGLNGYVYVAFPGRKRLLAHRVIYAMHHGVWPKVCDHIDGDALNNRVANLRSTDQRGNMRNARMWRHNNSGVTGVYWLTRDKRWRAAIKVNQKQIVLGESRDFNEAVRMRREAEKIYGFSERHGR